MGCHARVAKARAPVFNGEALHRYLQVVLDGIGPDCRECCPPAPLVPAEGDGGDRLDGMASVGGGVRGHAGGGRYDGGWHGPSGADDGGAGWEHQGGRQGSYRRGSGSKRYLVRM